MDIRWIAATFSPRDIAPHPNFMSEEVITPSSLFALLVDIRVFDYNRIVKPILAGRAPEAAIIGQTAVTATLLGEMVRAISMETSASGVRSLAQMLTSGDITDLGCATAVTLFCSAILGELELNDLSLELIDTALERIQGTSGLHEQSVLLAEGALRQQRAFKQYELGGTGKDDADSASDLLDRLTPKDLPRFEVSRGVAWNSTQTLHDVVAALKEANAEHLMHLEGWRSDGWTDVVRARPSFLDLRTTSRSITGYQDYVNDQFESVVGSSSVTFSASPAGDASTYAALLFDEMRGSRGVTRGRLDLGTLRFLRSVESKDPLLAHDAIRLVRQSGNAKRLKDVVRRIRSAGPLESLKADALLTLDRKGRTAQMRKPEFIVLDAAATLLSTEDASRAFDLLMSCMDEPPMNRGGGWQAESSRLEDILRALVSISATAERVDETADRLLSRIVANPKPDELLDRVYARALTQLEWQDVSRPTALRWNSWLDSSDSIEWDVLTEAVIPHLRSTYQSDSSRSSDNRSLNLSRIAAALNDSLVYGSSIPPRFAQDAVVVLVAALKDIQDSARRGVYSGRAYSAAEIAVGVAFETESPELWDSIGRLLVDPSVSRGDKSDALERIALRREIVPESFTRTLREGVDSLLGSAPDPMRQEVSPYPAALRCLAAIGAIGTHELLLAVARLSGSRESLSRVEAARTLGLMARRGDIPDWVTTSALQLSQDGTPDTQAEAGRALALISGQRRLDSPLALERVRELLAEDGILLPLYVLRGVQDVFAEVGPDMLDTITELASSHPARIIRVLAQSMVDSGN